MNTNRRPGDLIRILLLLALSVGGLSACQGPTQFTSSLSDPGTTAFDPRLIGTWIGTDEEGNTQLIDLRSQDNKQLRIEYREMSKRGLTLTGHASELSSKTYYNVKPDFASYFRNFPKAEKLPHYLLFRVQFVKDDEVFVWTSYSFKEGENSLPGLKAKSKKQDEYLLVDVSRDELRAALLQDNPFRVLNSRIGPYFKVASRGRVQSTLWMLDERSGCAVGGPSFADQVTWSGDCRDGKASGKGLVDWKSRFRFEGTLVEGTPHGSGRCSEGGSEDWKSCQFHHGQLVKDKN